MEKVQAAYRADPGLIGTTRDGMSVVLAPMTGDAAVRLGTGLAAIDPWARINYSAERFSTFLGSTEDGASRYQIIAANAIAGTVVVRNPWLAGPYLNILGLLPGFSGRGIGDVVLTWFEAEARRAEFRNIWLCVSSFNSDAERFYHAQGFAHVAQLDDLTIDGSDEMLMRKRLA